MHTSVQAEFPRAAGRHAEAVPGAQRLKRLYVQEGAEFTVTGRRLTTMIEPRVSSDLPSHTLLRDAVRMSGMADCGPDYRDGDERLESM
ncbi:hypothetical protein ABZ614_41765 [Streptomyces sp. NPDC013178]|uniref:hypothetical protein n=1 Tax=Streptomyces sp. NPDC013178 TaxID=3155118 RepID=UPI003409C068